MYIEIQKEFYEKLKEKFKHTFPVVFENNESIFRFGSQAADFALTGMSLEQVDMFYNFAKEVANRSVMSQLGSIRSLMSDPFKAKIGSLRGLVSGLIEYLSRDTIDGWLYQFNGTEPPLPFLVKNVEYIPANRSDERPCVSMILLANSAKKGSSGRNAAKSSVYSVSYNFDTDDIHGRTIPELLASKRLYKETKELKEEYVRHTELFLDFQPQFNKQFVATGIGHTDWDYRAQEFSVSRCKLVNDEGLLLRKFTPKVDPIFWRIQGISNAFEEIPFHCFIYLFHLDLHENIWVHASYLEPYVYDLTLKDKLILPQDHNDLIDILVEDMDVLMSDIIEGKSGGTTILCVGPPGTGKTLSAEVYSEVIQRPLYKVHSGQLGTTCEQVEKALEAILKRASRWGAVLLIDEADVYIRKRGDDLHHNAVVAAFLRTLEYFDGLLFMTTNRGDDVDDAILSRCIAVVKYEAPSEDAAFKIWKVLSKQFKIEMSDELISELTKTFKNISGRDIKELLKLTSKFAKGKNLPLSTHVFKQCAQFRGI